MFDSISAIPFAVTANTLVNKTGYEMMIDNKWFTVLDSVSIGGKVCFDIMGDKGITRHGVWGAEQVMIKGNPQY